MDAAPLSLHEALAAVPDPRSRHGRYYSLSTLLSLVAVAVLAGQRSLEAIARFGRDHGTPLAHALGFRSGRTPCKATLSTLLRRLDGAAFERVLLGWLRQRCPDLGDHPALDGKTLRGTAGYEVPGAHLLTACAPQVAAVVGQLRIGGKTNEHKAALELLGTLPPRGKVVTGDAMSCRRDFRAKVLAGGGEYLLTVKDNQPQLRFAIASMFAGSAAFSPLPAAALAG